MTSHPSAGFLRRLGAMFYDFLLLIALHMTVLLVLVRIIGVALEPVASQPLVVLETYLFFTFFWLRSGQTLGMLAWKLRIEQDDGARLTLMTANRRLLGALLGFVALFIGYLWILFDPDRRAWSDLLSGGRTVVVADAD
ncbi:MAG: RDD family protein [Pseudomonadota bacterium]